MANYKEIHDFAVKYHRLYMDPQTREGDVIEGFGDQCFAFGFKMDCGNSFVEAYSKDAFNNSEALDVIIEDINDVDLLASAIFSQWRYVTHWDGYSSLLDDPYRQWFITAFARLAAITEETERKTPTVDPKGSDTMKILFDSVYERDMDLLFIRRLAEDKEFVRKFFLSKEELAAKGYDKATFTIVSIAHSVMTEDGESDIEAVLDIGGRKIALLIEDKIDAIAMPEQAERYNTRGDKAIDRGDYDEYHVFIVAPEAYLKRNSEAQKYPNKISYEEILENTKDEFEKEMINYALSDANIVRLPRDAVVTAFWDRLYDFLDGDERYRDVFNVHGKQGLERSGKPGQWITISCADPYRLQIKSDRGYVDLEIRGYAERFAQFSKDNLALIDEKRLYVRTATKSLAIRKYVDTIDFTEPFESQIPALEAAFDSAKELQELIPKLIIR